MNCTVVCISHTTGSGGEEIGRLVAERLDFRYVNEDVVALAAAKGGVNPGEIADEERRKSRVARLLDELARGGGESWAMGGLVPPAAEGATSDELRAFVREAIEETAGSGRAVIVAHAASHALGGRAAVLRVLVTASPETRAKRVAKKGEVDASEAGRTVKEADAARADYLRRFHSVGEEQSTQYDLVLNTDLLSLEEAAGLISQAVTR